MHVLACGSQVFRFTFVLELASYRISVCHLACGSFQNFLVNDICRKFNMQLCIIYSCSYMWYKISQLFFAYEANLSSSILTSFHPILKDLFTSFLPFLSSPKSKSHELDDRYISNMKWCEKQSFSLSFLKSSMIFLSLLFDLQCSLRIDYISSVYIVLIFLLHF